MIGLRLQRRYGYWSVVLALGLARPAFAQARVCVTGRLDTTQTASRWSPPLDRPITLHASDLALRNALDRVATMAKLRLSYSAELLPLDHVVCVAADAAPVGKVLADLLRETNLAAVGVGGDQVVLAPRANAASHESAPDMSRTVGVLDRVVVTGSAAGASQRELSVGLDVVDGRQLARDNTNTLSGALDSYVPGVWSWTQSPTSMLGSYASIRGASSFGLSYPKIYIDGIEVANPLLVSRFNPGSIDRIEVIRGPQGSALYGTDAISGVVNIVTRHEGASGDGTRASVRTTAGVSQSAFTHNVLAQDHAVSLVSGSSTRSADLHVSGGSIGAFIPDGYSRDFMASGSARVVGTNTTLAATARFFMEQAGTPNSPLLKQPLRTPDLDSIGTGLSTQPSDTPQSVRQYTIGTTGTFTPDNRWTHSLVAGIDGYRLANAETNFTPFPSLADSALRAAEGGADRGTLRASSVLHLATTETSRATLTFSAEHATLRETSMRRSTELSESGKNGVPPRMQTSDVVTWQNSSGFTTQANVTYNNTFFATGGFRVEHDSRLAAANQLVTLPMFGGAAVRDYGPFTFKVRAAYGKGIRPPATLVHSSFWQTLNNAATQAALGPEVQSGTEVGFDMLFQHSLSLQVTRFDQRASGLVQQVAMAADSGYQSRHVTYALEDVGEISNRGWEIAAAESVSRLSVTGALSFVGSRVTKLANGYTGDLRTGDRMLQVPATTVSLNASWTGNRWYASLGGARALNWINYDELAMTQQFTTGSHPAHELLGGEQLRQYWRRYNGGLRLRASFSREIRDMLSLELSGDNLLNFQRGEPDNITVVPGRTIMSGVRVKF